jgi:hypothetical protein
MSVLWHSLLSTAFWFFLQTNRFFRSRLFPQKQPSQQDDQEGDAEEKQQDEEEQEERNPLIHLLETTSLKRSHTERDKTLLVSLLHKIAEIDALLTFVNTRKLQYQKG